MRAAPAPRTAEGNPIVRYFADKPRGRVLAGAAFALVVGYLPATLYASSAEDTKYGAIRRELVATQAEATTLAAWEALDAPDGPRATARQDLERARGRIRTGAGAIWLIAGGALAFAWFRVLAREPE
jgi:hypothetical protein